MYSKENIRCPFSFLRARCIRYIVCLKDFFGTIPCINIKVIAEDKVHSSLKRRHAISISYLLWRWEYGIFFFRHFFFRRIDFCFRCWLVRLVLVGLFYRAIDFAWFRCFCCCIRLSCGCFGRCCLFGRFDLCGCRRGFCFGWFCFLMRSSFILSWLVGFGFFFCLLDGF